jgi:hypothetical protein
VDLETVKTVSLYGIIVVAAIGLLMAVVVKKIVGKIISLVLAAAIVLVGWQQRDKVLSYAEEVRNKACTAASGALENASTAQATSFFGITVSLPDGWCVPA